MSTCIILGWLRFAKAGHHFNCSELTLIVHQEERTSVNQSTQNVSFFFLMSVLLPTSISLNNAEVTEFGLDVFPGRVFI